MYYNSIMHTDSERKFRSIIDINKQQVKILNNLEYDAYQKHLKQLAMKESRIIKNEMKRRKEKDDKK